MKKYYSMNELKAMLGAKGDKIMEWVEFHQFPKPIILPTGYYRFPKVQVDAFLETWKPDFNRKTIRLEGRDLERQYLADKARGLV